ncbi:TPA: hypothetical protein I3798_002981 [Enterobacter cloacae]|jgi:hypothetical protein|uniref:DUF6750 family protein n=1 Tax=Enterobacteriaceae TaxID=543 RepID=UPI000BA888D1|nr:MULTISPECIES: DUF6750 family protein [Enterobacteriaceae]EFU5825491.1 hypothetical protein [Shigella sonnei]HBL6086786.1 hypothetical protein [Enterobacter hormaechei]HCJ6273839.1 hypothetical protein [Enterobacter hormaechei subsp. xiangfangensis]HDT4165731.1 hypothetical protein [Enterobacter hormaechei subsp. steigerwaltii]EEQ2185732.1 hypothetical protein [Escherichia coli]
MRNFTLFLSVRILMALSSLRARLGAVLTLLLGPLTLPAYADDDIFGMFDGVADSADNSGKSILKLAKFGGIGCVAIGICLWVAKKKNPQIGWGWVLTFMGAGFVMIALDQFIKKGQTTIKLNPVDVG